MAESSATTLRMINYINWMGKTEIPDFKRRTGVGVHQIVVNDGPERVTKIATDPSSVDFVLMDLTSAGPLDDHGLLAKLDWSKIPNYKNVPGHFKQYQFSEKKALGMVSDFGRTSFVYRTDMVKEDLKSWHDVWRVAPKYSGKIVLIDSVNDTMSAGLTVKGHNINSRNASDIKDGRDALISIKPHLHSLSSANALQPLPERVCCDRHGLGLRRRGRACQTSERPPEVGGRTGHDVRLPGGLGCGQGTKALPQVQQFMNNHLDPKVYAQFVNTLSISNMMPAALKFVNPSWSRAPCSTSPRRHESTSSSGRRTAKRRSSATGPGPSSSRPETVNLELGLFSGAAARLAARADRHAAAAVGLDTLEWEVGAATAPTFHSAPSSGRSPLRRGLRTCRPVDLRRLRRLRPVDPFVPGRLVADRGLCCRGRDSGPDVRARSGARRVHQTRNSTSLREALARLPAPLADQWRNAPDGALAGDTDPVAGIVLARLRRSVSG